MILGVNGQTRRREAFLAQIILGGYFERLGVRHGDAILALDVEIEMTLIVGGALLDGGAGTVLADSIHRGDD